MKYIDFISQLIANPQIAFQSLRKNPNFWFPLLTIAVLSAAIFAWFYSIVDLDWLREQIMLSNPQYEEMSEAQRAKAAGIISKNFLMWGSVVGAFVSVPFFRLLEAVYYLLTGKITRVEGSLKQWFALACWSAFPGVLVLALMAVAIITRSNGQITPDSLSMLSLNELFFHTPMGHKWHSLLTSITILNPYLWWLTIVGVKTFSARSTIYSAVVVLVPIGLIYSGWALFASLH